MLKNCRCCSRQGKWKLGVFVILALLLLAGVGYAQTQLADPKVDQKTDQRVDQKIDQNNVILQGSIQLQPTKVIPGDQPDRIQPGTPAKLMVTVENNGMQASPAGQVYVRYAFAHPLDRETASVIFETEKKPLPSIEPGKKIDIAFDTPHQIPSLLDFVRYDWSMREYQAIAVVNQQEHLIGTLAITFSAYYYPGIKKEFPTKIVPQASN